MNIYSNRYVKFVNRHKNRYQSIGSIFLLGIIIITMWCSRGVFIWLKDVRHSSISTLIIIGERYFTTDDDINQLILTMVSTHSFVTQNVYTIQKKIEQLAWIKKVNVLKQWPNKLKIYLTEYIPIARWNNLYFLDNNGKIYKMPLERITNTIPMFYGPEGSELEVLSRYHIFNKILFTTDFYLKTVKFSERHTWQLTLQNGITLKLGKDNLIKRLQCFTKVYPILLQQAKDNNKRINYIDLRYNSGFAVDFIPIFTNNAANN